MPMKMGWRWYGEGNDPVTLSDIKQIPGVTSIVWALHNKMPGEIWEIDEIQKVADQIHAYGFDMDVVESVNVHAAPFPVPCPGWPSPAERRPGPSGPAERLRPAGNPRRGRRRRGPRPLQPLPSVRPRGRR